MTLTTGSLNFSEGWRINNLTAIKKKKKNLVKEWKSVRWCLCPQAMWKRRLLVPSDVWCEGLVREGVAAIWRLVQQSRTFFFLQQCSTLTSQDIVLWHNTSQEYKKCFIKTRHCQKLCDNLYWDKKMFFVFFLGKYYN